MTNRLTVVPATKEHACIMAPLLRLADRQEIEARTGQPPLFPLLAGLGGATCLSVLDPEGEPVAMGGVAHGYDEQVGEVWLLGTDKMKLYWSHLLRQTPHYLDALHETWPILHNFVDARNALHIRWLKRMGFRFLRTIPDFGVERRPFHEIVRVKGHV